MSQEQQQMPAGPAPRVAVTVYVTPEGQINVQVRGQLTLLAALGLLEIGKQKIMESPAPAQQTIIPAAAIPGL